MTEKLTVEAGEWLEKRGIPFSPEVLGYGDKGEPLDEATVVALSALMTNTDRPVMAFTDRMPVEDSAALFARYSRSPLPLRLVYVREFRNRGDNLKEFFERVLSGFGDDSVAQLGTVRFACEMVSQLAVKEIEDTRIGASFLEKSTRYVDFGKKINNSYLYLRPPELMRSDRRDEYEKVMDEAFDIYGEAFKVMLEQVRQKFPRDGHTDPEVYKASTRAKAFDLVRVFLPMATLTNVGAVMTAQATEVTINKMMSSRLEESRLLAEEIFTEASRVAPSLLGRIGEEKYGGKTRKYLADSRDSTVRKAREVLAKLPEHDAGEEILQGVELVWNSDDNLDRVTAAILYPRADGVSLADLRRFAGQLNIQEKSELVEAYLSGRADRRHKPGRAFEEAVYGFEYVGKTAEWRDLQRHRMLTQERQLFTADLGFVTPEEFNLVEMDGGKLSAIYVRHMEKRKELFGRIREEVSPEAAQYVVGFGHKHRWRMTMNLREMYHLVPLRASAAGHPDYRRIAREMFYLAAQKDPVLVMPMAQYIDFSDEPRLERLQQLAKIRETQIKKGINDGDTFAEE